MTGRTYYLTTLGAWRECSPCFVGSHWVAADPSLGEGEISDSTAILVLVEADEGAHATLEQHPQFAALPHPLAGKPVPDAVAAALAPRGVRAGTSTFDVAEALGRAHPLLRYRVF